MFTMSHHDVPRKDTMKLIINKVFYINALTLLNIFFYIHYIYR